VASRSGAATEDTNELYSSRLIPGLVIIAILAAAILISHNQDGPSSP
jgi:hypothetical protein